MSGYPIQRGKVQQPVLREETLARARLLDWLSVKIHNRVVFVIAEAGYGKTTLLADFARRSRLRALWYRLDADDRDWVGFMSHLVAAGREHDPEFAPRSAAMLRATDPGGPQLDDVLAAFIRELQSIATEGAVLIFDDFHLSDESPDIKRIARELVLRAPERLTLVFSSRREPAVPVARLRALGELAELRTDELRFSAAETEQLFRDTYQRPLDPDVLADLSSRTEGWAASLSLVQTALRDRSPSETRHFIRTLSGATRDIRDYLAEEVVGDLSDDLRSFILVSSLLQRVEGPVAGIITGADRDEVERLTSGAERVGLLVRAGTGSAQHWRYHTLLLDYLRERAVRELGPQAVDELHRRVAASELLTDWRVASYHYHAVGDLSELAGVLRASTTTILASGDYDLADQYLQALGQRTDPDLAVIRSRALLKGGSPAAALEVARHASRQQPDSTAALLNLMSLEYMNGDLASAGRIAEQLQLAGTDQMIQLIAKGTRLQLRSSVDGSLGDLLAHLQLIATETAKRGDRHFEGITHLNTAWTHRAIGNAAAAQESATRAIELLAASSAGWELPSAHAVLAWSLAHQGHLDSARSELIRAAALSTPANRSELRLEWSDVETWYGDAEVAEDQLARVSDIATLPQALAELVLMSDTELRLRTRRALDDPQPVFRTGELSTNTAVEVRRRALHAHWALHQGSEDTARLIRTAIDLADRQGAALWGRYLRLLLASIAGGLSWRRVLRSIADEDPAILSALAEDVAARLHELDENLLRVVEGESQRRPERWRPALRDVIDDETAQARAQCAELLDIVGSEGDVPRLRAFARGRKGTDKASSLGRGLARRLAPKVLVEDQGRVQLRVGTREMAGNELRRKVLALLCFLLTRSSYAATRDEVLDGLWPDLSPDVALNSLNQTVYFLRRVFEPNYKEDLSPGYVHSDSDLLWLDEELISSRSGLCLRALDSMSPARTPDEVEGLSRLYQGRFALDFAYEEWAVPFREGLHGSYLEVIESAVMTDLSTGHHERGIRLARRTLAIDPNLDALQLLLVRLYRTSGAYSAAAEQYERYSTLLHDELGIDAPPLDSL